MSQKLVYTVDETLQELGVARATLYRFINSGQLRTVRIGKRRLIAAKALEEFLDSGGAE